MALNHTNVMKCSRSCQIYRVYDRMHLWDSRCILSTKCLAHNPSNFYTCSIVFGVTKGLAAFLSCYQVKVHVNSELFVLEILQTKYKAFIVTPFVLLPDSELSIVACFQHQLHRLINIMKEIRQLCVLQCMLKQNPEDCLGMSAAVTLHRWAWLLLQTSPMSFLHQAQH